LSDYGIGQRGGAESLTLGINNMPSHNHRVKATNDFADKLGPGRKLLAADNTGVNKYREPDAGTSYRLGIGSIKAILPEPRMY